MYKYIAIFTLLILPAHPGYALTPDPAKEIDSAVSTLHEYGLFNGVVLAAKGDEIIYHEAFGKANFEWDIPNRTDTRFKIASITKAYTATLVLRLIELEKLAMNDVITDYLPDYPGPAGDRITLEHLLIQSDGIPDYIELPNFLENIAIRRHDKHEFIHHFTELALAFEPGSDWSYGNSGYYLLGLIIESTTGMSYESAMQKYVLDIAGLHDTGYASSEKIIDRLANGYITTPAGREPAPYFHSSAGFSAGMIYATAHDIFKWSRALVNGDLIQHGEYLQNMVTPQMEDYGYGVFIGSQKIGDITELVIGHSGNIHGFSSQLTHFSFSDYTLIILDNTQQCTARTYFTLRDLLFGARAPVIKEPVSGILGGVIEDKDVTEAIRYYSELRERRGDECDFSLYEFVRLGDHYLENRQPEIALEIFKLGSSIYPGSSLISDRLEKAKNHAESVP